MGCNPSMAHLLSIHQSLVALAKTTNISAPGVWHTNRSNAHTGSHECRKTERNDPVPGNFPAQSKHSDQALIWVNSFLKAQKQNDQLGSKVDKMPHRCYNGNGPFLMAYYLVYQANYGVYGTKKTNRFHWFQFSTTFPKFVYHFVFSFTQKPIAEMFYGKYSAAWPLPGQIYLPSPRPSGSLHIRWVFPWAWARNARLLPSLPQCPPLDAA